MYSFSVEYTNLVIVSQICSAYLFTRMIIKGVLCTSVSAITFSAAVWVQCEEAFSVLSPKVFGHTLNGHNTSKRVLVEPLNVQVGQLQLFLSLHIESQYQSTHDLRKRQAFLAVESQLQGRFQRHHTVKLGFD